MGEKEWGEPDRLIQVFYAAAFHSPWAAFRLQVLEQLCTWSGAVGAAWLTRAAADLRGEFAVWPAAAGISHDSVVRLGFAAGVRERERGRVERASREERFQGERGVRAVHRR